MSPRKWLPWAVPVAIAVIGGGLALWLGRGRVQETIDVVPRSQSALEVPRSDLVTLYFGDPNSVALQAEQRTIAGGESLQGRMGACVRELAAGSYEGGLSVVPPSTRLRGVLLDSWGVAYLDFTRDLLGRRPLDDGEEWIAVAAIVRTICDNFPEVTAVRLLLDGEMIVSLGGYLDLENPLAARDFPLDDES